MQLDRALQPEDGSEIGLLVALSAPRLVHGTVWIVLLLLGCAVAWAGWSRADLVVRAPGRVRPATPDPGDLRAEPTPAVVSRAGGRVVEVLVQEGDSVRRGDVLLRLDTERLDNEIARLKREIRAGREEVGRLARLRDLEEQRGASANGKAQAELAEATGMLQRDRERRAGDVRLAEIELESADLEERRFVELVARSAAARADLERARDRGRQAKQKLALAAVPADEGRLEVLRRALELAQREGCVRREEIDMKREAREAETEAAQRTLANLELDRAQAEVRSHMEGIVTAAHVRTEDCVQAGTTLFTLARRHGFWFEASVRNADVAFLHVGMPVRIRLDAFDPQKYGTLPARLVRLPEDAHGSDDPTGVGGGVYVAQVALEAEEFGRGDECAPVKLGMTGTVEFVTGEESLLSLLLGRIRREFSLK